MIRYILFQVLLVLWTVFGFYKLYKDKGRVKVSTGMIYFIGWLFVFVLLLALVFLFNPDFTLNLAI